MGEGVGLAGEGAEVQSAVLEYYQGLNDDHRGWADDDWAGVAVEG